MPSLKILPGNIANMIAAGEVVQRPASVVKELMENAVDAGASSVTLILSDSGRTLVQVIDDGCGMSPQDAVLCFERHATSKIATAEDLNEILTFGFRGEALASIAAVADVTLKTRRECDEVASVVNISDVKTSTGSAAAPKGSNFAVRNLFYNVPARRKFLKSPAVELRHCVEEFTRVALTRPDIAFTLRHNGKDMFVLKKAQSLKFRILDLLGSNVTGDIVDVSAQTSVASITGFVGRPDSARKTLGNQYFFVNGRFFRSPYLHKAVMKAYEDFIPEGLTPSYFIYLEVDPHSIDVNIHPTKTEIKFEDDSVLFQTLYACIRETLGRNSFGAAIDFEGAGEVELPVLGGNFSRIHSGEVPQPGLDPAYNPFEPAPITPDYDFQNFSGNGGSSFSSGAPSFSGKENLSHRDAAALWEDAFKAPSASKIFTIQDGRYIVAQAPQGGIMTVNVRRARERVLYEKFLRAFASGEKLTQSSLFPVEVKVGVQGKLLFDENKSLLESLGFDIAPLGEDGITVSGVPDGYSCESGKVDALVSDLLLILSSEGTSLKEMMDSRLASRFAMLGASLADPLCSSFEAQKLLEALLGCENSEFTHNGRRIISVTGMEEIEKKFI